MYIIYISLERRPRLIAPPRLRGAASSCFHPHFFPSKHAWHDMGACVVSCGV